MNDSESPKKIESLTLENFTVFENATFDFCPVINVLIGENSTGKTHVLKASYGLMESLDFNTNRKVHTKIEIDGMKAVNGFASSSFQSIFRAGPNETLIRLFSKRPSHTFRHIQKPIEENSSHLSLSLRENKHPITISLEMIQRGGSNSATWSASDVKEFSWTYYYLPSDDLLSKNEYFTSPDQYRKISYGKIYQDLFQALTRPFLPQEDLTEVQPILDSLQTIIAGEDWKKSDFIKQENGRFYFELPEGKLDVHLIADGYRKFGTLWYLLRNGSISKNSILFWDEPETSLNPKLTRELVKILQQLAAIGVQIFIATHDYLLSYELSLLNEYPQENQVDIKFFSLHKPSRNAGVVVEAAKTLAEIDHNPIIEAYAAYHDHESALFHALENP